MVRGASLMAMVRPGAEPGQLELLSPRVGLWRGRPAQGALIHPGADLGAIEVLGRLVSISAPDGAMGMVVSSADETRARVPVGYKTVLLVLDPERGGISESAVLPGATAEVGGLVFAAPMSGRFYERPGPDKPPFIAAGDEVKTGDSVCLLEVMKTFNRVTYGGAGLPARARVRRVVPADGADLNAGDPILELEAD